MTQYLIFIIVLLLLEGLHDGFEIEARKMTNVSYDRWWHRMDVIVWMWVIAGLLWFWVVPFWTAVVMFCLFFAMRAFLFNLALNIVRELLGADIPLFHLGKTGIEGWFVKHKVSWSYWLSALVLTIILIVI